MKTALLCLFLVLQMVVWPIYCGNRVRGGMALTCYFATFFAFWLGWFAR